MNRMALAALAEPNRLRIVEHLRGNPSCVGDIALQLMIRQPQVSKHLKILSEAGWVEVQPQAQLRVYRLRRRAFDELESWIETFRRQWEANYQRLDALLENLKENDDEGTDLDDSHR